MTDNEILDQAVVKAIELCKSGTKWEDLLKTVCSSFKNDADKTACKRCMKMEDQIFVRLNCPIGHISGGKMVFKCPSSFGRTARDRQISKLKGQVDSMESELVKRDREIADLKTKLDSPE